MSAHRRARSNRISGTSLLEVLITLFVFAIGVLGVAGLQVISKKTNFDAIQHTQAGVLAFGIMERMRANAVCLSSYLTENVATETEGMVAPNCSTEACGGAAMALYDLVRWRTATAGEAEQIDEEQVGGVTSPTGCVQGPADGSSGLYTVAVAWRGISPQHLPDVLTRDDPRSNACGLGKDEYDDADEPTEGDNRMRRILVLESFIANPGGSCPP